MRAFPHQYKDEMLNSVCYSISFDATLVGNELELMHC